MKRKTKKKPQVKLTTELILDVYDGFLREGDITKVAASLDTTCPVFLRWLERFPQLQLARERAESRRVKSGSLASWVFGRLSPDAQKLWNEIKSCNENGAVRVERILSGKATEIRQELFVHALVSNSFNLSEACRMVNLPRPTLEKWRKDPAFLQLLEEIEWHKKNFFEGALVRLVETGNPGATMFVNRTINRDRGYGEVLEVKHDHELNLKLDDLDLSVECRREILQAIRAKETKQLPQGNPAPVIDIEPEREFLPAG